MGETTYKYICMLCNEPLDNTDICGYCGFQSIVALDKQGTERNELRIARQREVVLKSISEVGFYAEEFVGSDGGKVVTKRVSSPLLKKPLSKSFLWNIHLGSSIDLYCVVNGKKADFSSPLRTVRGKQSACVLHGRVNDRLKLDIAISPAEDEGSPSKGGETLVAEDILLGVSLVRSL